MRGSRKICSFWRAGKGVDMPQEFASRGKRRYRPEHESLNPNPPYFKLL